MAKEDKLNTNMDNPELENLIIQDNGEDYALIYDENKKLVLGWDSSQGLYGATESEEDENYEESIRNFLETVSDFYAGESIKVTPEGPFLSGSEFDGASVAWALNTIYGSNLEIVGSLPTMEDLGLDQRSNINEDGSPRVR